MEESSSETEFTTLMRRKTRQIHNLSDSLVQSKFVIGIIDDRVWAEGLLVFYEVFKFLENCMENTDYTNVNKFYNPDLMRTSYFEADLQLYYGPKWKDENPLRECVQKYITHLENLRESDTDLLIPYIYHLYLGLLSGGRILRRKQKLMAFSKYSNVSSVVDFDAEIVSYLKKFIKETMNDIARDMDERTKNKLLEESVTVFKLNCDIIRSVNSANSVVFRIARSFTYVSVALVSAFVAYWYFSSEKEQIENSEN